MIHYPLSCSTWGTDEHDALYDVISSGNFTMSTETKKYEAMLADYHSKKYAVMVNSGSSANLLMIAALMYHSTYRLRPGDEVLVPVVSWATTYSPIHLYGLNLKFVDVDLNTLNIDLESLRCSVTNNTKALLAVNLLGNANEFSVIKSICDDNNLILLEDNCESLGAEFNNNKCGSYGLMSTMSSFYSHHISTMEGGAILTDDIELYEILCCLRAHGWTRDLPDNSLLHGKKRTSYFYESFNFILPGYNVRPLEMSAAVGQVQLKKLDHFIAIRRANANVWTNEMSSHPKFRIQKEIGLSSWFGFSVIIEDPGIKRESVIGHLNSLGIETRPIVGGNFVHNRVVDIYRYNFDDSFPNAEQVHHRGFFIGNNPRDMSYEIVQICNELKNI